MSDFDKTDFVIGPHIVKCFWEFVDESGKVYIVEAMDAEQAWNELEAGNTVKGDYNE